jgi:putative endonuclease
VAHYVYCLRCHDDSIYTGYTTDVERRVREHDAGQGAKYTRGRTPVDLCHVETLETKSAALSREHAIKSLSRAEKEQLIERSEAVERGEDDGKTSSTLTLTPECDRC